MVYRKVIDFCVLTWLFYFIRIKVFYLFICHCCCRCFIRRWVWGRFFGISYIDNDIGRLLRRSDKGRHNCLFPILKGKTLLPLSMMLTVKLL